MKKIPIYIIALLMFALGCNHRPPQQHRQAVTTDRIIVKFEAGTSQAAIDSLASDLGLQKVKDIPELFIKIYKLPPGMKIERAIEMCQKNQHVRYAEPDYQVRTLQDDGHKE